MHRAYDKEVQKPLTHVSFFPFFVCFCGGGGHTAPRTCTGRRGEPPYAKHPRIVAAKCLDLQWLGVALIQLWAGGQPKKKKEQSWVYEGGLGSLLDHFGTTLGI